MTPLQQSQPSPLQQQKPIKKVILLTHPVSNPNPPTPSTPPPPAYPVDPIPLDVLTREVRHIDVNQIPLSLLLDRVVQDTYARFIVMTDTLAPNSDLKKGQIAEWTIEARKQIVKTYVIFKWASQVADDVQKAINITEYFADHNKQFQFASDAILGLGPVLGQARLRNPDILSAISLLTSPPIPELSSLSGKSQFDPPILPTIIHQAFKVPPPLKNAQIKNALIQMNDVIRFRLGFAEIIPTEMQSYHIANGRVTFTCPSLFVASFSLTGRDPEDIWYALDFRFLLGIGGRYSETTLGVFPTTLPPRQWSELLPGINVQLALRGKRPDLSMDLTSEYEPLPPSGQDMVQDTGGVKREPDVFGVDNVEIDAQRQAEESLAKIIDAPLVRAFNLLQLLSLSYQLEILHHQAMQLRGIGWLEYLRIEVLPGRRQFVVSYWMRKPPLPPPQQQQQQQRPQQPPPQPIFGGSVTISITSTPPSQSTPPQPTSPSLAPTPKFNKHVDKIARLLEEKCKLGVTASSSRGKEKQVEAAKAETVASDKVEKMWLVGKWERVVGALGVKAFGKEMELSSDLVIDPQNLDFEALLRERLTYHSKWILNTIMMSLKNGPSKKLFAQPDEVTLIEESGNPTLRLRIHSDEYLYISVDARTGKFILRDAGDLAAWTRGRKYAKAWEALNEKPGIILDAIVNLRFQTIMDALEHEVSYMGLRCFRLGFFTRQELQKLGGGRGHLFIKISNLDDHLLTFIVTEQGFKQALVHVKKITEQNKMMVISAIAWLDLSRIKGWDVNDEKKDGERGAKRKRTRDGDGDVEMHVWEKDGPGDAQPSASQKTRTEAGSQSVYASTSAESFIVDAKELRELYSFCCARVAYVNLQTQLKSRNIPCVPVFRRRRAYEEGESESEYPVPALGIHAEDIWKVSDVAVGNVKVDILDWWNERKCKVVTTVQLKPTLAAILPRSSASSSCSLKGKGKEKEASNAVRKIMYDPVRSRVSFLSFDVEHAVDDFLREWERVERMCRIVREVASMQRHKSWEGVRLLFFDFETVEFAYIANFNVAIRWMPSSYFPPERPNSETSSFELTFSRFDPPSASMDEGVDTNERWNPHEDASELFARRLQDSGEKGVAEIVFLLRETLPIILELEALREFGSKKKGERRSRVEILFKGVSWFRVVYSSKYAVDLRLQPGGQVSIVDASYSLIRTGRSNTTEAIGGFTALPGFTDVVKRVVLGIIRDRAQLGILLDKNSHTNGNGAKASSSHHRTNAPILVDVGNGILCSAGKVFSVVCKRLHEGILDSLTV